MFVDTNTLTEIKVYYKRSGKHYIVSNSEDYDIMGEEDKKKYKCLTTKVRELTWGLFNELNEESVVKDMVGERQWNYKLYKENKLRKILVSWDATRVNEKGDVIAVPVTPDAISKLAPDIAESILSNYDAVMFISEDEEKK